MHTRTRVNTPVLTSVRKLPKGIPPALAQCAVLARYTSGESIYRCTDKIEHWYQLVSGAARKSASSGDGRRHIVDFILPRDPFGLAAAGMCHFCVEALVPGTLIVRFPRVAAERLADFAPQVGRYIREAAFTSIVHLQRRMVVLGRDGQPGSACQRHEKKPPWN
jgi:CRP-like cAMP-binding protein